MAASVILFNKPFGVQSQFRDDGNNEFATLSRYFTDKTLRVAGRLDATSEGLLILTSSGAVNHAITKPLTLKDFKQNNLQTSPKLGKTYLVQVEGIASPEQLQALQEGVDLKDGKTLPAMVQVLAENELPMPLWERTPPIRERKNIPTSWLKLTIFEGKNRQVRRMSAHVGLPCLRLIRWSVAGFELGQLQSGEFVRVHLSPTKLKNLGIK